MAAYQKERTNMERESFGALLKRYRMAAGLSQERLAERASLSARAISDLERGLSRVPRYETIELLSGAIGLSPDQRAALFAAARPALPSERSKATAPHMLPLAPTTLLGRERELAQACSLIQAGVRLLTLTGPGGVGKTSLALEIARSLHDQFANGSAWIELAGLPDAALVPQTIAQAIGLREQAEQAFDAQIAEFLRDKHFLLLLDNFEHLVGAAGFLADLLGRCPHLHILVTSRVSLRLRAEQQLALPPLSQAASIALFRERAQRVRPGMDDALPLVAAICDQLDGLPLAIELAAGHVKALSLPVLQARLMHRLRLLGGGARDLPERHQTMREAIAWSYNLLGSAEQQCFRAMGTFSGGCTLAAAEAVCWAGETAEADTGLAAIAALVDASLVQVEGAGNERAPRYRMLEVIREYAAEQLAIMGEEQRCRRRHAEYYAALAEETERGGASQGSREIELEQETSNGRAALHWAYEQREAALGLRLATWFGRLWMTRGQMTEGSQWLERMLALDVALGVDAAPPAVRAKALYWAARIAMHLGDTDRANSLANAALALAEQTGEQADTSAVLAMLGSIALTSGSQDQAATYFTQSYGAAKHSGDAVALGLALLNLGELARKRGEIEQATGLLEEALGAVRSIDMTWGIANISTLLGHLASQSQQYSQAKARYRESLAVYQRLGNTTYVAWCLEGIAALACAEGKHRHAAQLCAAASALRNAAQTPLPPAEQEQFDRVVMTARAEIGQQSFAEAWAAGSAMACDEAIEFALAEASA